MMLKATTHREDINIYSPNIRTAFIKKKWQEIKGKRAHIKNRRFSKPCSDQDKSGNKMLARAKKTWKTCDGVYRYKYFILIV